jgi:hypothetical protein
VGIERRDAETQRREAERRREGEGREEERRETAESTHNSRNSITPEA